MPKTQNFPIGNDFKAEVVQRNLEDLYDFAHSHEVRTTEPGISEGSIGDILPVILGGVYYVYIKFPSVGWKRAILS
jgi:hypothetical protein